MTRAWLLEELLCSAHSSVSAGRSSVSSNQATKLLQLAADEIGELAGGQAFFDDLLDRCAMCGRKFTI